MGSNSNSNNAVAAVTGEEPSRWQRRTAKRRQRTEKLLRSIEEGGLPLPLLLPPLSHSNVRGAADSTSTTARTDIDIPTLDIISSSPYVIDWDNNATRRPDLDPMQGGKIRHGTQRGLRKRAQVQAFYYIVSSILDRQLRLRGRQKEECNDEVSKRDDGGVTIIDAGCGAGNLAIALAGLLSSDNTNDGSDSDNNINVLAVDVNEQALERLSQRAARALPPPQTMTSLQTCRADLANYDVIQSQIPPDHDVIVVSLHACGAASDMAMELAFRCNNAPFVICPCCTAKSLTKRGGGRGGDDGTKKGNGDIVERRQRQSSFVVDPSASFQRSGATADIEYPRSNWLRNKLLISSSRSSSPSPNNDNGESSQQHDDDDIIMDGKYTLLAKVADIGLGPQTPSQQREHQRRAKRIVELDRVIAASERQYGYDVRLMRIQDHHDPLVYGKGEMLLGALEGSIAADVLMNL